MDELKDYSFGFPCHKYIARNIETELDMLIFEREFSKLMLSCSFDSATIEVALIAMAAAVPKSSPVFGKSFTIKGKGLETEDLVSGLQHLPAVTEVCQQKQTGRALFGAFLPSW